MPAEVLWPTEEAIWGKVALSGSSLKWMGREEDNGMSCPKATVSPQVITNQKRGSGQLKFAADGSCSITLAWEVVRIRLKPQLGIPFLFRYQRKVTIRRTLKVVYKKKKNSFLQAEPVQQTLAELLLHLTERWTDGSVPEVYTAQ